MFALVKHVVAWEDSLYIIKRTIKESTIPEDFVQEYKEYIGADTVLKKNGIYYFVQKIDEAQVIEEEEVKVDETTEE